MVQFRTEFADLRLIDGLRRNRSSHPPGIGGPEGRPVQNRSLPARKRVKQFFLSGKAGSRSLSVSGDLKARDSGGKTRLSGKDQGFWERRAAQSTFP